MEGDLGAVSRALDLPHILRVILLQDSEGLVVGCLALGCLIRRQEAVV